MNYLLIFSAVFLGWTTMHIVATERERREQELRSRAALAAAAKRRASIEQPIVVG